MDMDYRYLYKLLDSIEWNASHRYRLLNEIDDENTDVEMGILRLFGDFFFVFFLPFDGFNNRWLIWNNHFEVSGFTFVEYY